MSNRTHSKCPVGHRMFFDPETYHLGGWWCPKCQKNYKLTPTEKRMVLVAFKYGIKRGKAEIRKAVKDTLRL